MRLSAIVALCVALRASANKECDNLSKVEGACAVDDVCLACINEYSPNIADPPPTCWMYIEEVYNSFPEPTECHVYVESPFAVLVRCDAKVVTGDTQCLRPRTPTPGPIFPNVRPTREPTTEPTVEPTTEPTVETTGETIGEPTTEPTAVVTRPRPTNEATRAPTDLPIATRRPTIVTPLPIPTIEPTVETTVDTSGAALLLTSRLLKFVLAGAALFV
ncbi:hypothetical protein JKP88DRAFT_263418 [Tribonema minus]|uniref:Uncharacterized protein n=1 Tax=Tribonema minus TaxID=303371 RepID=A0A836CFG7_9STRA|nr:hypothetical protein JKP88DRAFT_263418 [Tribonema minus]